MEKKTVVLIGKDSDSEPVFGDNDKFSSWKNTKRKCIIQVFVIDNARFWY